MLIADAINDGQQEAYEEGFEDGAFFKFLNLYFEIYEFQIDVWVLLYF